MDEFEREEIAAGPLENAEIEPEEMPEELQEELQEETSEEPALEELPEELLPEEAQPAKKAKRPVKGPGAWAWIVAVVTMLLGLILLLPAMWFTSLSIPAVGGLVSEATGHYNKAMSAYQFLYTTDTNTQGFGVPGLTSGEFPIERQYAMFGKLYGPLYFVQNQSSIPPIADSFPGGVPRSLRKLSAQCDELMAILEPVYAQLDAAGQPAEGQSESEWILETLAAAREAGGKAQARKLYYEVLSLYMTAGDPEQKQANLARIEEIKKDPAQEPWMHENMTLYFARQDGDAEAMLALSEARLKRNREDVTAMQDKVKALYLTGREQEAFKAADKYGRLSTAESAMKLLRAELYYRQGEYDKTIALCDPILEAADYEAQFASAEDLAPLGAAMEAARIKGITLMLQGKPEEARDLLTEVRDSVGAYSSYLNIDLAGYIYTLLAAHIESGDKEGAAALEAQMQISESDLPQAIADLRAGKTTVKKIFTEGWGGFDA